MGMLNFNADNLSLSFLNARQEAYLSNIKWHFLDIKGGLRNDVYKVNGIRTSEIVESYYQGEGTKDYMSLFVDARHDKFDDGYFPTRGVNAGLSYSWTFAGFGNAPRNFHILQADAKVVVPAGKVFAFIPSVNCRFLMGEEIPLPYFNAVGGSLAGRFVDQQIPFIGVTNLVAMDDIMTMFRADFRFRVAKNHYVTAIANYVRDCDTFRNYGVGKGWCGAGIEYSFNTIFGPLSANVHWSDLTHKVGLYLSAGFNF
jgi:NTE family protein